jgi:hypothetical protein
LAWLALDAWKSLVSKLSGQRNRPIGQTGQLETFLERFKDTSPNTSSLLKVLILNKLVETFLERFQVAWVGGRWEPPALGTPQKHLSNDIEIY